MADSKFSALSAVASVADAQEFACNDAGTSKKATAAQIRSYILSAGFSPRFITTVDADVTGANTTALQNMFPAAQDAFNAAAATAYLFELFLSVTNGATTCTKSLAFNGGSCTFTSIRYWTLVQQVAVNAQGSTQNCAHIDTAASTVICSTGTSSWLVVAKGIMRINAGGTLIPQFQFSADPTGTVLIKKDSYMILEPIGSNTVAAVGAWA